jgi:hypothetical protein
MSAPPPSKRARPAALTLERVLASGACADMCALLDAALAADDAHAVCGALLACMRAHDMPLLGTVLECVARRTRALAASITPTSALDAARWDAIPYEGLARAVHTNDGEAARVLLRAALSDTALLDELLVAAVDLGAASVVAAFADAGLVTDVRTLLARSADDDVRAELDAVMAATTTTTTTR